MKRNQDARDYALPVARIHVNTTVRTPATGWREQYTRIVTARTAPDDYTLSIVRRLVQSGRL